MKRPFVPLSHLNFPSKKPSYNIENVKTVLAPPFHVSKGTDRGNVYYHYTNEDGRQAINNERALNASDKNERGLPHGYCRIYFTDIPPELVRVNSTFHAPKIFGHAMFQSWQHKIKYCYVLNLSGITVKKGVSQNIYYIENIPFLPIKYILNGMTINRVIACLNVKAGVAI